MNDEQQPWKRIHQSIFDWRNHTDIKPSMLLMNAVTRDYVEQSFENRLSWHANGDPPIEYLFGLQINLMPELPDKLIILANEQSHLMIGYSYRALILE